MRFQSVEDRISQAFFELNKGNLESINQKKTNKKKSVLFLFSYLFHGGWKRIINRILRRDKINFDEYHLQPYAEYPQCKVVVYTCIWGAYDSILEPYFVNPNVDYVIFTNQEIPNGSAWKKKEIPCNLLHEGMTATEVNRLVKIMPHLFFEEYDYSVYIDGNVRVVTDVMPLIVDLKDRILGVHKYPLTDCIYEMGKSIIVGKKAPKKAVKQQLRCYKLQGLPSHYGAFECNILIRKHNTQQCIQIMCDWWNEFNNSPTKRDQLSFMYVLWKNDFLSMVASLGNNVRCNPRFQVLSHK